MKWTSGAIAAAMSPVVAVFGVLGLAVIGDDASGELQPCAIIDAVDAHLDPAAATITAGGGAYRGEQLANAVAIIQAGAEAGVSARGQAIGVMTAIGESSLINIMHGDLVGPDSIGLFQQRANGAWGSLADRTDPHTAATNFYAALRRVSGWEALEPTIAAHRVQGNADPYYYEPYWDDALGLLEALGDGEVNLAGPCNNDGGPNAPVGAGGWVRPTSGPVTSGFGIRWGAQHNGLDFGSPAGTPVYAAAAGRVVAVCLTNSSPCTGYGTLVSIDHGGGVVTRYAHAYRQDVLVQVGDTVEAGQQITRVGSNGDSTGPHLHFEVQQDGAFIDPAPWLTSHGIVL